MPGHVGGMRTYRLAMLALVALTLLPPVPGMVERAFAYSGDRFAPGLHRGVDLAAAPGERVEAACSGRVTFAGRAGANGDVVTIRCGRFSVTHLPIEHPAPRAGERIAAGAAIGTLARSTGHEGLHLGVRRAADPSGYIDPAPLLRAERRPAPPPTPKATVRRLTPPPPRPAPLPLTSRAPQPSVPPVRSAPLPAARPAEGSSPLAPWPAWAGLALLLAGAAGAGSARRTRRRHAARRTAHADPRAAPVP